MQSNATNKTDKTDSPNKKPSTTASSHAAQRKTQSTAHASGVVQQPYVPGTGRTAKSDAVSSKKRVNEEPASQKETLAKADSKQGPQTRAAHGVR